MGASMGPGCRFAKELRIGIAHIQLLRQIHHHFA
jgi:hypothetical protein